MSGSVQRTFDAESGPVEDVCVDHRGAHVLMPQEFLQGADVRPAFEQMRGEAVSQGVWSDGLGQTGGEGRFFNGALQRGFVPVMTPVISRTRVSR